jgi:hypothetical protein
MEDMVLTLGLVVLVMLVMLALLVVRVITVVMLGPGGVAIASGVVAVLGVDAAGTVSVGIGVAGTVFVGVGVAGTVFVGVGVAATISGRGLVRAKLVSVVVAAGVSIVGSRLVAVSSPAGGGRAIVVFGRLSDGGVSFHYT